MISCNQYDYVEIACMYRLPLVLAFKDGSTIECIAKDTLTNELKQECMTVVQGNHEEIVILEELKSMRVSIENPHFELIEFNDESCSV